MGVGWAWGGRGERGEVPVFNLDFLRSWLLARTWKEKKEEKEVGVEEETKGRDREKRKLNEGTAVAEEGDEEEEENNEKK